MPGRGGFGPALATALAVMLGPGGPVRAQQPGGGIIPNVGPGQGMGIGRIGPGQPLDTATARALGVPTGPTRKFPEPDSVLSRLLGEQGYKITRYSADSAVLLPGERRIRLEGRALTEQQGVTLEADSIAYREATCVLEASGEPHLFDKGQILVGGAMEYNTCTRRGIVQKAFTNFSAGQAAWFLRGNVAADSSGRRIYAASSEITSCDLPVPHYHFAAKRVKWVSRTSFVARPIVLYIRDVPILWLPFLFQDIRPGRRSGVLIPQFGFSDIIRPSRSYNRQITNIGYYWAVNDYMDLTARLDWFSRRYVQFGVSTQYNVLDRFLGGSAEISRQIQSGGGAATSLRWSHRQQFNLSSSLNFNINYVSNSFVVRTNALDPLQNTQLVSSQLALEKRYRWGTVTLGGNRRQNLSDNSSSTQLPALNLSPKPIDIGRNLTWSPALSLTNDLTANTRLPNLLLARPDGRVDTVRQVGSSRITALNLATPLRIGSFNWTNSVSVVDSSSTGRRVVTFGVPDPANPADSVTVSQVLGGGFGTGIDWQTAFNLPVLFQRTWKLVPSVGVTNKTAGPFALRNRNTGGGFVVQGKRFNFTLSSSPTFFAFLPGIGPLARIRHSLSPQIVFSYAPAASVSPEYARAIAQPGQTLQLRSDPTQTVTFRLDQTFEGKRKPAPGDTTGATAQKLRLLSISTSGISYDFEQAKKPGRSGWITQSVTNTFLTDLLPSFSLSLTHDLWRGQAGSDTAHFDPFLTSLQTNLTLTGNTFRAIGSLFGLGRRQPGGPGAAGPVEPTIYQGQGQRSTTFFSPNQVPLGRRPFAVTVNYTLSRTRPIPGQPEVPSRKNLRFATAFSPTRFWFLSWDAQYNLTAGRFESQAIQLQRDLHDWRASFNFTRNANGNVAVYFSIALIDLPELKFDYNQATFER